MRKEVGSREETVQKEIEVVGWCLSGIEARMLGVTKVEDDDEEDAVLVLARRGARDWASRFGLGRRTSEGSSEFWRR